MTAGVLAPVAHARAADQATRLRAMVQAAAPARAASERAQLLGSRAGGARLIGIASGKGGVGKTNLAVNLAIALSALGCRTILIDADLGTANADVLCGIMPTARLEHVVRPGTARRSLGDIAVDAPGGFRLIPGTAGIARMADLSLEEREELIHAIGTLEAGADAIVIDTAAGVGHSVVDFLHAADLSLVVTTPEPTAIADAYALIKCLCSARLEGAGSRVDEVLWSGGVSLVVNQAADLAEARAVHGRIAAVCARFLGLSLPLAGCIAQDLRIVTAVRQRRPLLLESPRSPAARDIQGLALVLTQQLALGMTPGPDQFRRPRLSGLLARLRRH